MTTTDGAGDAAKASAPALAGSAQPVFTDGYKRLVLILLVVAYTLNFIDRTIISTIGQAIKDDLKITDLQLGLLGGLYFALLYTFLGIPLARFAERFSRVNIITGAIVIWSAFTALCGTAASFTQLALYRFGVGVGEAGLSPPAHSIISDYYEPRKRASALAVYSFGIPLGSMLGAVIGGVMLDHFTWRVAFMLVGVPGLVIAAAIKLLIKEPPRGHSEPGGVQAPAHLPLSAEFSEIWAVVKSIFGNWPVANMALGMTLVSFAGYGGGQFAPPYFIRTFGLSYGQVGLIIGLVAGLSNGLGTLIGGPLTDRLANLNARWYALTPAIGAFLAFLPIVGVYSAPTATMATLLLLLPGVVAYTYLGPTFGVVQNMVPSHRRATAAAILLFFVNLIALGGGPPFTGWLIDHLSAYHLAEPGSSSVWSALAGFGQHDPAAFQAACPGGTAPAAAGPAAAAACKAALILGTRQGIILSYGFLIWGGVHYVLAAFGLAKAMAKARADRGEA